MEFWVLTSDTTRVYLLSALARVRLWLPFCTRRATAALAPAHDLPRTSMCSCILAKCWYSVGGAYTALLQVTPPGAMDNLKRTTNTSVPAVCHVTFKVANTGQIDILLRWFSIAVVPRRLAQHVAAADRDNRSLHSPDDAGPRQRFCQVARWRCHAVCVLGFLAVSFDNGYASCLVWPCKLRVYQHFQAQAGPRRDQANRAASRDCHSFGDCAGVQR